jgi:manganese-dependent inorganic pyrophosphatase
MDISKLKQLELVLVTCYKNPDLDGYASAYAYAEYLQKRGVKAVAAISGKINDETSYILKKHKVEELPSARKYIEKADAIILVDASDTIGIDEDIKPSKVIQIIDHRTHNDIDAFKKAEILIETIGATSTLVAEFFIETNTPMSPESTVLLYAGIISNTVNLRAKVTANRDKRTAMWLTTKYEFPTDFVEKMFKAKSAHKDKTIYEILDEHLATFKFHRARVAIIVVEMNEAEKFVAKNIDDILKALRRLEKKYEVHHIFLKVIDLGNPHHFFVAEELETQKMLIKNFQIEFEDNIAFTTHMLLKKEMTPVLKHHFEGKDFDLAAVRPKDFNHFTRHHDEEEEEMPEPAIL